MDVLRHTGRAELASFLGGSNAGADASQWQFAPYTEADLERQLADAPQLYGALGQQAVDDVNAYVEGINAYVAAANLDPKLKPGEYTLLNKPMEPWKSTDVIAIASLIGGIFGQGGGNELNSALTMQAFVQRMGKKAGRRAWLDFRSKNDPEAPTTISKALPLRDPQRLRQARSGAARPEQRPLHRHRRRLVGRRTLDRDRRPAPAGGDRSRRPRFELGARLRQGVGQRPPDRGDGPAGRLLRAADPAGGRPARPGNRRPRRRLPRGQPLRRARPRARLRLERDDGDLGQRRHLRRGSLQGQLPLPLPRQVPGDGKARKERELDPERGRLDAARLADADRLPHRSRDRLRPRQGRRQEGRLRPPAQHLLPRGRLGDRVRAAERTQGR